MCFSSRSVISLSVLMIALVWLLNGIILTWRFVPIWCNILVLAHSSVLKFNKDLICLRCRLRTGAKVDWCRIPLFLFFHYLTFRLCSKYQIVLTCRLTVSVQYMFNGVPEYFSSRLCNLITFTWFQLLGWLSNTALVFSITFESFPSLQKSSAWFCTVWSFSGNFSWPKHFIKHWPECVWFRNEWLKKRHNIVLPQWCQFPF